MDNLVKIDNCPICSSTKIEKIVSVKDYLVTKEQFDIYECTNCELRFTSPIPNEDDIRKYYKSDKYISHNEQAKSIINKIYKIVQNITLSYKRKIVENQFNNKQGTLLDIGCGTGHFLNIMKISGWGVCGVEIDETARETAKGKIGNNVFSPQQFFKNDDKYDVITFWHSLEHLHNLKEYVKKTLNVLNKNGILFIAVPNHKSFDAKYYGSNWAAYDAPRHLYHFSFEFMERLFNEYGFEIIRYKQLPFDPFYIALLSETAVKGNRNILLALWIGLRSFIAGMFNSQKGSSILYEIKKIEN